VSISSFQVTITNTHLLVDVHVIGVHPKHQGRKAGAAMVKWGIEMTEQLGMPLYFEASPSTAPLYSRMGYHTLKEKIVHKAEDMGIDVDIEVPLMIRMPSHAGGMSFEEWREKGYPAWGKKEDTVPTPPPPTAAPQAPVNSDKGLEVKPEETVPTIDGGPRVKPTEGPVLKPYTSAASEAETTKDENDIKEAIVTGEESKLNDEPLAKQAVEIVEVTSVEANGTTEDTNPNVAENQIELSRGAPLTTDEPKEAGPEVSAATEPPKENESTEAVSTSIAPETQEVPEVLVSIATKLEEAQAAIDIKPVDVAGLTSAAEQNKAIQPVIEVKELETGHGTTHGGIAVAAN
jgi:tRNA threonylcarbamoyladenosine modification (KEOPS) complex  Pcc1 subunit